MRQLHRPFEKQKPQGWKLFLLTSWIFLFGLAATLRADYAWIPDYDNLNVRLGMDYTSSDENFSSDSDRVALSYLNQPAKYSAYNFWLEPEYGFAQDWAASLRFGFNSPMVNGTNGTLASSSGPSDIRLSTKWQIAKKKPLFTAELYAEIPTYSDVVTSNDDLLLGDATFAAGLVGHLGYKMKRLYFALSPGFRIRTRGLSSQFTVGAAIGYALPIIYFRLFSDLSLSTSPTSSSTVINQNTALGTGGTFAIAAPAPSVLAMGLRTGLSFKPDYRVEVAVSKSMFGSGAANYILFTVDFLAHFDFYKKDTKLKVKEVPFEKDVPSKEEADEAEDTDG